MTAASEDWTADRCMRAAVERFVFDSEMFQATASPDDTAHRVSFCEKLVDSATYVDLYKINGCLLNKVHKLN